jgi:tetratricopeptide (TPR) repeat protein
MSWEKHGLLLGGMLLCAVAVFVSMSRNGAISLLVAAAIIGSALYRRGSRSWQGWLLGLLPIAVLLGLFLFGFESIYVRLATLEDSSAYASRWEMTKATLDAWRNYPVWGTGLGTHRYVFPMFDTAVSPYLAEHADNDYAQLLEEAGILGATLVGLFVIGIGKILVNLVRRGRTPASSAAFGLGLGLIAVAIHSATDFGQRLPANFALSATFCGLLVSISRIEDRDRSARRGTLLTTRSSRPAMRRATALAALIGVLGVSTWALRGAYADFLGERWFTAALAMSSYIQEAPDKADDQDYADLLTAATTAYQFDPSNVHYGYWLNAYRWDSLSRVRDPETKQLVLPAESLEFVARIADDLDHVRPLCPTYGPPYALEGQLRYFILGDAAGAELIRKGLELAPYDPPTCLAAGELAVREGELENAESLLERAVELRPAYFKEAIKIYLLNVERPDLAQKLAGDDHGRLRELAEFCAQHPSYAELAKELKSQSHDSLRRHAQTDAVRPSELAALAHADRQNGNLDASIELYRRALAQDYNRVEWRLALAQALADDGQVNEAIHEAKICLRLRPQYRPATALLEKLNSHTD